MTTQDIAKFSSSEDSSRAPTPRRRPRLLESTTPAPRAVQETTISTGLPCLDAALALPLAPQSGAGAGISSSLVGPRLTVRREVPAANSNGSPLGGGGVRRGEITDIAGPRGTGKTALAMELAGTVLRSGQKVIWIDTAGPINPTRFKDVLRKASPKSTASSTVDDLDVDSLLQKRMMHFQPPSLSHLLALISHPPPSFPPQNTGLIVIDSISSLFSAEFRTKMPPKDAPSSSQSIVHSHPPRNKSDIRQDKLRWKLVGNLSANLKRTAARLNCPVITINEMASRFRPGRKPMLHEALSGTTWDSAVSTRIVLYFHWLSADVRARVPMRRVRIAEVVRSGGVLRGRSAAGIVPFVITKSGVHEFCSKERLSIRLPVRRLPAEQRRGKRKFGETFSNGNGTPKSDREVGFQDAEPPPSSADPYIPPEAEEDEDDEILQELLEGEIHDMDPAIIEFEDGKRAYGDEAEALARDELKTEPEAEEDYGWSDDDTALVTQLLD